MIIKSILLCLMLIITYAFLKKIYTKINNLIMVVFYTISPLVLFFINFIDLNNLFLIECILIAWIQTTPALKSDIPSLIIYKTILEKKSCSEKSLKTSLGSLNLFNEKVNELMLDNLIFKKNGVTKLTLKGKIIAKLFIYYRKILKLPEGAG